MSVPMTSTYSPPSLHHHHPPAASSVLLTAKRMLSREADEAQLQDELLRDILEQLRESAGHLDADEWRFEWSRRRTGGGGER